MSIRQRKEILEKLHTHFVEYNLPKNITIDGYMTLVAQPILRRAIKKNFRNWPRTVRALEIAYPDLFTKQEELVEPDVQKADDPLAALGKAKAAQADSEEVNEDE